MNENDDITNASTMYLQGQIDALRSLVLLVAGVVTPNQHEFQQAVREQIDALRTQQPAQAQQPAYAKGIERVEHWIATAPTSHGHP